MEKFKVGDWVRSTKHTYMHPAKIESIYESNYRKGDYGLKCGGTVHYASEVELWQPKEGEWCWFWNKHQNKIVDRCFEKFTYKYHGFYRANVGQCIKSFEQVPNNFAGWDTVSTDIYSSKSCAYEYCEPFIGNLPSFLQH